jgi:hypothetical protein
VVAVLSMSDDGDIGAGPGHVDIVTEGSADVTRFRADVT